MKVKLVKQIADGMEYMANMYEHPWLAMHGNLKSCNVLVQRETMTVKLCDFGQGNLKDLARTMTSVGTVAWTGLIPPPLSLFSSHCRLSFHSTVPEILNREDLTPKLTVCSFGIIRQEIYTPLPCPTILLYYLHFYFLVCLHSIYSSGDFERRRPDTKDHSLLLRNHHVGDLRACVPLPKRAPHQGSHENCCGVPSHCSGRLSCSIQRGINPQNRKRDRK
jgi:serine/threonine protein kinase